MSAQRWSTALALLLGLTATFGTPLSAHAHARSIQVDTNHVWQQTFPPPDSFSFAADGSFVIGLTAPGNANSFSELYSNSNTDVVDWCDDTNPCNDTTGDVPAQLYVTPSALAAGDVQISLYFLCTDSFGFSVDGNSQAEPNSCPSSASTFFQQTYIYSPNGSLIENYVPEPGTGALFAAAFGLVFLGLAARRRWRRTQT